MLLSRASLTILYFFHLDVLNTIGATSSSVWPCHDAECLNITRDPSPSAYYIVDATKNNLSVSLYSIISGHKARAREPGTEPAI